MFLYSLTVQPPNNVVQAVLGQFAGTKEQLIITGAGSQLTLLRPDPSLGKVTTVLSHNIFGIIRSLAAFRLAGSSKGMKPFIAPYIHLSLAVSPFVTISMTDESEVYVKLMA